MNNNARIPRAGCALLKKLGSAWLAAILLLAVPVAGYTQETTTSVRGAVSAPDGTAASGVDVRVTDTRTGRVRSTTTTSSGRYQLSGLAVGGPYTVTFESSQYAPQRVTDVMLALGETYEINLDLSPSQIEEIVVTAAQLETVQVAVGPNSTFNLKDLENLPSINRDIRDIIRVDPRVYVDEGFVDSVQCLGANPRFNSITVDGIKQNDNFGLNSSGYPTQRMPFPYDTVQNVAIEMAPFDVEYGGFTACNINAVTRAGSNDWTGRAWIDYNDDSLSGDELEGTSIDRGSFDETRYGFSLGGPIIKDKLFFFLGYEYSETADTFSQCAGDQACGSPVTGTTQAQIDRIRSIAETLYQFDPGEDVATLPNEDEKYLIRVDWNVTENHSAALVYSFNDGFNFTRSDDDDNEYEFSNHWYERGAEFEAWTGHLFSDWTDALSTEVRIGFSTLDNRQLTRDRSGFGEVQVETYDADGNQGLVYLGTDDSRQSNKLDYETTNLKFAANYALGDHLITAGYEYEEIDIFNLFVQHTIGEYRFDEMCNAGDPDGCIDAFENFRPDDIFFGSNVSLDPADSAASFAYAVNTLYLQDEFTFDSLDLTIVAGLRYDWYTSDDLPVENPNFVARSGFSNRQNFDGESLVQPRLGFQWNVNDSLTVHGGAGLFSGGNPNVWLANNYQNDGFTQVQSTDADDPLLADLKNDPVNSLQTIPLGQDGNGRPIYDAPQSLYDFVANSTANSAVNAVDPNFKLPQAWKFSLGAVYEFGVFDWSPFTLQGDLIYSIAENSALIVDDTYVEVGETHDGRPVYFQTDKSVPGCAADPLADPFGCTRQFTSDHILTNVDGDDAEQLSLSFVLSQTYDFGLDWSLGYAFTDSEDVNPMTSSVSGSNYFNVAVYDPNDPGVARSNYEIPHRFVLRLGFEKAFFGDYYTRFNLVGSRNKGRPYSYTMDQDFQVQCPFGCSDNRSLLYVPDGPSDPNVIYGPNFDQQAFFDYLQRTGLNKYAGGIAPRNEFYSPWWTKVDLRISQDIPSFAEGHFAQAFIVVENLTNLLNDDWGVFYETGFPRTRAIVTDATLVDTAGTPDVFSDDVYSYNSLSLLNSSRVTSPSLWAVRIGLSYNF